MNELRPFLMRGVTCARCGHSAHSHNPITGMTHHAAAGLPPCPTRLPIPPKRTSRVPRQ